jgi:hypothetical protein
MSQARIDELNKQRAALGKALQQNLITSEQFNAKAASTAAELLRLKEAQATTVAKTVLNNAEAADKAAEETLSTKVGDRAGGVIDAAKEKAAAAKDSLNKLIPTTDSNVIQGLSDTTQGSVSELTGNLTTKLGLPEGAQNIADGFIGEAFGPEGIIGSNVKELKTLEGNFNDITNLVKKPTLKGLADFVSPGDNPQRVIDNAAKGTLRTFVFPEDYSPDLCFRLDFLEFNRQNAFAPIKADPKATFVFPLPTAISVGQGVSYSETELGVTGEAEARVRTNMDKSFKTYGDLAETVISEATGMGGSALFRGALQTDAGKAASLALGFIPNPHLAAIFSGVSRRKFSFSIKFAPRTKRESETLQNVLDHVRSYILPAMSQNFVTLDYPHEVAISFSEAGSSLVQGGQGKSPLDRIFKFKRCICENITINVNDQAGQSFFDDFAPTHTTVNFEFSEVQIQVANDYGHSPTASGSDDLMDLGMSLFRKNEEEPNSSDG